MPDDPYVTLLVQLTGHLRSSCSMCRGRVKRKHYKTGLMTYPMKRDLDALNEDKLRAHIDGSGDVRGCYLFEPGGDTVKGCLFDLDDKEKKLSAQVMRDAAWKIREAAARRGWIVAPWHSSGGHGVHLWVLWDEAQDAYSVRETMREILTDAGLTAKAGGCVSRGEVEIFPKQDKVQPGDGPGSFGNQAWLPLAGKSAPLKASLVADTYISGRREDVLEGLTGYLWPLSEGVEKRVRPEYGEGAGPGGGVPPHSMPIGKIRRMLTFIAKDHGSKDDWSYATWMQTVAFGLHHETEGSEEGFQLWFEWSLTLDKGADENALRAKWMSIKKKNDGSDGRVVTLGSVMQLAAKGGWSNCDEDDFTDMSGEDGEWDGEPLPPIKPVIANERNHLEIAERLIREKFKFEGGLGLWRSAESSDWFVFNGKCYDRRVDETLTNDVRRYLSHALKIIFAKRAGAGPGRPKKDAGDGAAGTEKVDEKPVQLTVPFDPTAAQISSVFNALKTAGEMPFGIKPPCWLGGKGGGGRRVAGSDKNTVVMDNGLLDLSTRTLAPHSAAYFSTTALPYAWDGAAEYSCPQWLTFLGQIFNDQGSADCLQEIMGYLISPDTSLQKMFLIKGLPRSGKGTIARVATHMLGDHNVEGTTLNQIGEDFGLWPLLDKTAVFVGESRTGRAGSADRIALAIERLLMISGEDKILCNTKGGRYQSGKLGCRIVMLANDVPAIGDSSGAFASRFITLETTESFIGKEDEELTDNLITEISGIFRWSLDGLDRLRARGRFVQPAAGKKVLEELADMQNPIRRFMRDCCVFDNTNSVTKDELYVVYKTWFQREGMGDKANPQVWFGRGLVSAYRELSGKILATNKQNSVGKTIWPGLTIRSGWEDYSNQADIGEGLV